MNMSTISQSIDARVAGMLAALPDEPTESDSTPETESASAPLDGVADSGVESASADGGESPAETAETATTASAASPEAPNEAKLRHQLLEEKLAAAREERQRVRAEMDRAKAAADAAEADRKAAAEERAKYDNLKKGTFLETIKALGHDPRETFEQMKAEAIESGTPEAQIRKMEERFAAQVASYEKKLADTIAPLQETIDRLTKEKAEAAEQATEAQFAADFQAHLPQYEGLRSEYDDEALFGIVRGLKNDPSRLYAHAQSLGLTLPANGFNMIHILDVLKATQERHERIKRERQAKAAPPPAAPAAAKTVNGTTDKRNAGSALGNDLATSRASGSVAKPRLTFEQRIQREIEKGR